MEKEQKERRERTERKEADGKGEKRERERETINLEEKKTREVAIVTRMVRFQVSHCAPPHRPAPTQPWNLVRAGVLRAGGGWETHLTR